MAELPLNSPLVVVPAKIARSVIIHTYSVDASSLEVNVGLTGIAEDASAINEVPPVNLKGQEVIDAMVFAVRRIMAAACVTWGVPEADAQTLDLAIQSQPDLAWKLYYAATRDALYDQVNKKLNATPPTP